MAKLLVLFLIFIHLFGAAYAEGSKDMSRSIATASSISIKDISAVSPALARYAEQDVVKGLWTRPELSLRDRSIVTVAILIARNQTIDLPNYLNLALDNDVSPPRFQKSLRIWPFMRVG